MSRYLERAHKEGLDVVEEEDGNDETDHEDGNDSFSLGGWRQSLEETINQKENQVATFLMYINVDSYFFNVCNCPNFQ